MKTDRELLELAAKAAGIELIDKIGAHFIVNDYTSHGFGTSTPWNPLENDGDALRLAVKLGIDLAFYLDSDSVEARTSGQIDDALESVGTGGDPNAATRRAIVRAAAAIGESMR